MGLCGCGGPSGPDWSKAELPPGVVVRKEIRSMPREEQERIARAFLKMRENIGGSGTSPYFKMAVIHGGMPPLSTKKYPEYCAHRRTCFAPWHRPYMLEFERMLRRADLALGGDSNIGLPYWDWTRYEVNGEVFPRIIRDELTVDFPSSFFPIKPSPAFAPLATLPSDASLKAAFEASGLDELAFLSLRSSQFLNFACTASQTARYPSVEAPHNTIHGYVGGIMGTFQSAFHPVFWMHHCNVDRLFETYLQLNPDSWVDFQQAQAKFDPGGAKGYPNGPAGPFKPFVNHLTGEAFNAADCFTNTEPFGFLYDALLPVPPPQMREPPWLATFWDVNVLAVGQPCLLHVYVAAKGSAWERPPSDSRDDLVTPDSFAGSAGVFFLNSPAGCENCRVNKTFDVYVDVTPALRRNNIMPRNADIRVLVEFADGTVSPIEQTRLPPPQLNGPRLTTVGIAESNLHADDGYITSLQQVLIAGCFLSGEPSGVYDDQTVAAVKRFQEAAGLEVDGLLDSATRDVMLYGLILSNDHSEEPGTRLASVKPGEVTKWTLVASTVPSRLRKPALLADLRKAFALWGEATEVRFEYVEPEAASRPPPGPSQALRLNHDTITVSFDRKSKSDPGAFDGPGGQLAHATADSIVFDPDELWDTSDAHSERKVTRGWDEVHYQILNVALHEIGHCIGLSHSEHPGDIMLPFYSPDRTVLSENDILRARMELGLVPSARESN